MAALRRRSLLTTALATTSNTTSPGSGSGPRMPTVSDTRLIRLCDEFIELEIADFAIFDGPNAIVDDDDAAMLVAAPGRERQRQIIEELGSVQAATAAGVLARARALAAFNGHFAFSFDHIDDDGAGRMLAYLMRDAATIGAPLPRTVAAPPEPRRNGDAA